MGAYPLTIAAASPSRSANVVIGIDPSGGLCGLRNRNDWFESRGASYEQYIAKDNRAVLPKALPEGAGCIDGKRSAMVMAGESL